MFATFGAGAGVAHAQAPAVPSQPLDAVTGIADPLATAAPAVRPELCSVTAALAESAQSLCGRAMTAAGNLTQGPLLKAAADEGGASGTEQLRNAPTDPLTNLLKQLLGGGLLGG